MPILICIFITFNWLPLTSEMHFVKFHSEVASCLLSRGKRKYAPLVMRPLCKYIKDYFLVYHLTLHFLLYLQKCKEFEAEILDLPEEKYGLSFDIKHDSSWALGDENVIGIRFPFLILCFLWQNHLALLKDRFLKKMFLRRAKTSRAFFFFFLHKTIGSNNSFTGTLNENNFRFLR